ncbi:UvrABC system protein A [Neochlamydia sp. TUME1]|uniref:excinuclease ABC subunit UvrA n=1 Tax=Neochlamydia sp. TUME1 TaxID=1478174 RepID=UPI00057C5AD1|nr:excinuclease ABC subunit UvrA [Neochlamydia sp. TUME1]KIC76954.1 UvrABC system protein A [Neochlamydia sp. TUME1]
MDYKQIILKKVKVHNLKAVDLQLNTNELIVFSGVSGSGKSSLAFDTIYMEGQRRYVESLSTFARRQLGEMAKPDLEHASGISPTISIEQKTAGRNPRSTVGTMTEIYDYLRVLYARVGIPHCPVSGEPVAPQSRERIIKSIQSLPSNTKLIVLAPYAKAKKAEFKEDFQDLMRKGFTKARVDGKIVTLQHESGLDGSVSHDVDVVIDRLAINMENNSRIAEAITTALDLGNGVCSILDVQTDEEKLFSTHAYSPKSGLSYSSLEPHDFSFNSPSGACPSCNGLGIVNEFDLEQIMDPNLSIAQDCCSIASSYQTVRYGNIYNNLANMHSFNVHTPWKKLSEKAKKVFLYGVEKKWTRMHFVHPITGAKWVDNIQWKGVLHEAHTRFAEAKSDSYRTKMLKLMHTQRCPACNGERLKPYPAATLLNGKRISQLAAMTIAECYEFFSNLSLSAQDELIAAELIKEIRERLQFLIEVGLHYLNLDRTAPTLSGGEAQRVRLASQIGCGLVGITYVLDEPSIGLHPRDNKKLIATLKRLRDMGNTVIVVEHDEETIWEADHIVDFGPGPGTRGGEIVYKGDVKGLLESEKSLTGQYLSGRLAIAIPKKRRKIKKEHILIKGATHHNLKNVDAKIPLGVFIAVTGVSGSGKSSLITDILYPALSNALHESEYPVGCHKEIVGIDKIDKVIAIDQSPIGRNPRSNPATYIKLFDDIRDLFTQLPESQARGYKPGRFSFNVKEGSCPQCGGMGMVKIDMDFMEDAWIDCPLCKKRRFDQETLSVLYKGKSIYDVLEMEVLEALEFFANIPSIYHKLETLQKVGMEYIKLGQSSTTLSGGEAQRIKLAKELARPASGHTFYIFDEPTTGLHFHDIKHLLTVLQELVDRGHTVLVIEHNMDIVKTADWIIDIGPEGGIQGGKIFAVGTPEQIARLESPTGRALQEILHHDIAERITKAQQASKHNLIHYKERQKHFIKEITVTDAEQNNLKSISLSIPREKITICTGPSGSGKTSLAFDTIYAEGQRRYIDSLSPYARQFVKQMPKPKVGYVGGLSPAIAIEQKAHAGNPRSTIGTMTELYDYLRILYARMGTPHCPETGEVIKAISKDHVVDRVMNYPLGEKIQVLAPIEGKKNERFEEVISRLQRQGFLRVRLNGEFFDLEQEGLSLAFDRKRKNELLLVIDRLKINPTIKNRLAEAVETATHISGGKIVILRENQQNVFFNLAFAVESTGKSYPEITPHTFAFNNAEGMCPECLGLGYQYGANLIQKPEMMEQSVAGLMYYLWQDLYNSAAFAWVEAFLEAEGIDLLAPLFMLPTKQLHLILNGSPEDKWYTATNGLKFRWTGINHVLAKAGRSAQSQLRELITPLLEEHKCISCQGDRLNALARHVTIQGLSISKLCSMPVDNSLNFIEKLVISQQDNKILEEVHLQLLNRLRFLAAVGLGYIALDRRAPTLSGGEAQRIRLARQLGSGLTGVLYVLDEPTIGLHPRDNERLNLALEQLKELGNTLLMVEHDPLTIAKADYILDFGPQAGALGGHVTAQGTFKQIIKNPRSLTGKYLSGKLTIPMLAKRRSLKNGMLQIREAKINNLKSIQLDIPIGALTILTGVSGSGKSTLMHQVIQPAVQKGLYKSYEISADIAKVEGIENFDKVITIDQNPLGHTVRSDVGTYVDLLARLRDFFSSLPAAKAKGLQGKHFSYNHRRGMCTHCWGMGYKRIEMHFLPPIRVVCEECQGQRLNPVSLEITYKGKNFGQYLSLTINEARHVFENHPRIAKILDTLIAVGLGYLKLGQETVSLSGGEAQRLKLSRELTKRSTGKTLYLLDEPTTGLHSDDIKKLLIVLHKLVDKGNTMIVIEHNIDVIKNGDFIVDLGPEAGERGGEIVAIGTPEEIAQNPTSITGKYLKNLF